MENLKKEPKVKFFQLFAVRWNEELGLTLFRLIFACFRPTLDLHWSQNLKISLCLPHWMTWNWGHISLWTKKVKHFQRGDICMTCLISSVEGDVITLVSLEEVVSWHLVAADQQALCIVVKCWLTVSVNHRCQLFSRPCSRHLSAHQKPL